MEIFKHLLNLKEPDREYMYTHPLDLSFIYAHLYSLSLYIYLLLEFHINGNIQYLFCV